MDTFALSRFDELLWPGHLRFSDIALESHGKDDSKLLEAFGGRSEEDISREMQLTEDPGITSDSFHTIQPSQDIFDSPSLFTYPIGQQRAFVHLFNEGVEPRTPRDNPYYGLSPKSDGKFYCPFASAEKPCSHPSTTQKSAYHKYLDSHFKPYHCKDPQCADTHFTSSARLFRHEREAHGMHGHGENPNICHFSFCERSIPGNGFPRRWNLRDHMKRVHDYILPESASSSEESPVEGRFPRKDTPARKRKGTCSSGAQTTKRTRVIRSKVAPPQAHNDQQLQHAEQKYYNCKSRLLVVINNLNPQDPPSHEMANALMQVLITLSLYCRFVRAAALSTSPILVNYEALAQDAPTSTAACSPPFRADEMFASATGRGQGKPLDAVQNEDVKNNRLRSCIVCIEDRPICEFPKQATKSCHHPTNICRECLQHSISVDLKTRGWDMIRCPECKIGLEHADVQRYATVQDFETYDRLATRAALIAIQNFRWCLNPKCESGQIHESGSNGPIFTCASCKFRSCTKHNQPWHEGETCDQFEYRKSGKKARDEEAASEKLIAETTKKCPKCDSNIEKNLGCDHMTCLRCSHEFCWICLVPYRLILSGDNSNHKTTCKYYAPRR